MTTAKHTDSQAYIPPVLETLVTEASRCVACGLCLPHCPTYHLTGSEADSPRGRIAMINGVATGRIPANARFIEHIDRCLTCRACEAVCPNHVAYGQLVDNARAMIAMMPATSGNPADKIQATVRKSWLRIFLEREFILKPWRFDTLRPLLHFYQHSGLQQWVRKRGLLARSPLARLEMQIPPRINARLPVRAASPRTIYPATGSTLRGEVGLFLGCVARLADTETTDSAILVLNRLGYTVHIPPDQTCCGALHNHSGDKSSATRLAQQNIAAFPHPGLQAIISTASGCGAQLAEYPLFPGPENKLFATKATDILAFLAQTGGWEELDIKPLPHTVAVHEPCTLRNVLRGAAHAYTVLSHIPDVRLEPLAGNARCCGAAGTYFLDQPEMSADLLNDKIASAGKSNARYLATANIGCALHIASGLNAVQSGMEVLHPVTLIARQL